MTGSGRQALDPASFPDPAAMVRRCDGNGTKVVLWIDPHVHRNGSAMGHELQAAHCMASECEEAAPAGPCDVLRPRPGDPRPACHVSLSARVVLVLLRPPTKPPLYYFV